MRNTDINDKNIGYRESRVEYVQYEPCVYTEEDILNIENKASLLFDNFYGKFLKSSRGNLVNIYVMPSYLVGFKHVRELFYSEEDKCYLEKERTVPLKKIDEKYYQVLVNKLKELASEKKCFLMINYFYDEDKETYFIKLNMFNKRGLAIEYQRNLEELKSNYLKFQSEDKMFHLSEDSVMSDGYISLLMVNETFKELDNKGEIMESLGFVVDEERRRLLLIK